MGPFVGVLKFLGYELGRGVAKVISKESEVIAKSVDDLFPHAKQIESLTRHSGVSASFLKELADNSHTLSDLNAIHAYISDVGRSANLTEGVRSNIMRIVTEKADAIQYNETLRELVRFMKEHGEAVIDDLLP